MSRFPVPGDPGPLAIVDRRIWIGTLHDTGSLTRITMLERDGHIDGTMPLPDQAAVNIAPAPGGGAWVAFGENGTVSPAALRLPNPSPHRPQTAARPIRKHDPKARYHPTFDRP